MKYLITGARGFIGSHLRKTLLSQHHEVLSFDHFSGDLRNINELEPFMPRLDGIFHLAAYIKNDDTNLSYSTNVQGTQNILLLAKKHNIKKIVFTSSSAIYGNNPNLPLNESDHPMPLTDYAKSKLQAEILAQQYNLDFITLRCFNVWDFNNGLVGYIANSLQKKLPLTIDGDGFQTRDFVHIQDVVQCLINAMTLAPSGHHTFNCCSGIELEIRELISLLAHKYNTTPEVNFIQPQEPFIQRSCGNPLKAQNYLKWKANILLQPTCDLAAYNS